MPNLDELCSSNWLLALAVATPLVTLLWLRLLLARRREERAKPPPERPLPSDEELCRLIPSDVVRSWLYHSFEGPRTLAERLDVSENWVDRRVHLYLPDE